MFTEQSDYFSGWAQWWGAEERGYQWSKEWYLFSHNEGKYDTDVDIEKLILKVDQMFVKHKHQLFLLGLD